MSLVLYTGAGKRLLAFDERINEIILERILKAMQAAASTFQM